MAQMNINLSPEFQENLAAFMRLRGLHSKSEGVRVAVREALDRETARMPKVDWTRLIGWANQLPEGREAKSLDEDAIWEKGRLGP